MTVTKAVPIFLAMMILAEWSLAQPRIANSDEPATGKGQRASDAPGTAAVLKQRREESAAKIAAVKVTQVDAPRLTGELIKNPLMTYTDEPLVIDSATVWAWTLKSGGRPLALCKVEHYDVTRLERRGEWLYCFASLSPELIHAEWPDGHEWTARQPGVLFRDVPAAAPPGETPPARLRQMKDLSRKFTATIDFDQDRKEELRLLVQPLIRYADSDAGVIDGTVFTAAVNGTNPTAMFLIELQQDGDKQVWRFAAAAMTDGAVLVEYD
ncbi:MAG TPA: hypothetical protein VGH74_10140, partial [Planctomycetaceae bacterium]